MPSSAARPFSPGISGMPNALGRGMPLMPGGPPVSLMLVGRRMGDARLFAVAAAVEALFAAR